MSKEFIKNTLEFITPRKRKWKCVKITEREIEGELVKGKVCRNCGEWKPLSFFRKGKKGAGGYDVNCKICSSELDRKQRKEHPEKVRVYHLRRLARIKHLPNNMTINQLEEVLSEFNNICALTSDNNCLHFDHIIPLSTGHGGTYRENIIPLRADLNVSKNDDNIFEWFEANKERFNLSEERFNRLIEYLATVNGLTVNEYRQFVYWCHENPREPHEIAADPRHSIEIWREATGRHFPLPAYAIENDNMSDNERSAS